MSSMYRRFHDRFGTVGVVLGVIAIVLALGGSALAASGLNGKQKKEVKKIAKSFQGTGPQGSPGQAGAKGATGASGSNGSNGTNGVGVTTSAAGAECAAGGTKFTSASGTSAVCNGAEGPPGPACPSGACYLPSESTETGIWGTYNGVVGIVNFPISFSMPLENAPQVILVKLNEGETNVSCPGEVNGVPQADPGKLCVYMDAGEEVTLEGFKYASPAGGGGFGGFEPGATNVGTLLKAKCEATFCFAGGTWAVTAE